MDSNGSHVVELDIKDIFLFILKKALIILLVGVVFAVAVGGYGYIKSRATATDNSSVANVLDVSTRLSGESDIEYGKRVQLVGRAQTIMANIETMNAQSDNLRSYISNSLFMQLDPMNVSVSEAQFIIELDDSESIGLDDALIDSYSNVATSGDCISIVAEDYGYEPGLLQELISAKNTDCNGDVILNENMTPVRMLTILVYGDSSELTEDLLDAVIDQINDKYSEFNSAIAKHSLTEIGRQNYVSFIYSVRESQLKTMTTYQTLQAQIDSGNKYLDDIAKQLGLTDRNSFYADITQSSNSGSDYFSVKYIAIGFLLGMVLAASLYFCMYLFGQKILSQAQFFCLFPNCRCIGVLKPSDKRNRFISAIDRLSGDDTGLSAEKTNMLVSANILNLTSDMNNVLITGTVSENTAKQIVEDMQLTGDVKMNIFANPEILRTVSEYDGVVLIEQRAVSEKKKVMKEFELLSNGAKTIVGAIII